MRKKFSPTSPATKKKTSKPAVQVLDGGKKEGPTMADKKKPTRPPQKSPAQKEAERKIVVPLLQAGKTEDQIHRETGISKITIGMFRRYGEKAKYKSGGGLQGTSPHAPSAPAAPARSEVVPAAPVTAPARSKTEQVALDVLQAEVRFLKTHVTYLRMKLQAAGLED